METHLHKSKESSLLTSHKMGLGPLSVAHPERENNGERERERWKEKTVKGGKRVEGRKRLIWDSQSERFFLGPLHSRVRKQLLIISNLLFSRNKSHRKYSLGMVKILQQPYSQDFHFVGM